MIVIFKNIFYNKIYNIRVNSLSCPQSNDYNHFESDFRDNSITHFSASSNLNDGSTSPMGFNCRACFSSLLIAFSIFRALRTSRCLIIAGSSLFFFFKGSPLE